MRAAQMPCVKNTDLKEVLSWIKKQNKSLWTLLNEINTTMTLSD